MAGKHRYGNAWEKTQTGVSVHLDGGAPDLYATVATPRFEIGIYSNNQEEIVSVWRELIQLMRNNARFSVDTSQGDVLVHYVLPESSLSLIFDDELNMDMGIVFVKSMMSEVAIA